MRTGLAAGSEAGLIAAAAPRSESRRAAASVRGDPKQLGVKKNLSRTIIDLSAASA